VIGDVRAVEAIILAGGEALHGRDRARRRQHRDEVLRHLLVQNVGEHDQRLVARGADGGCRPPNVLGLRLRPGRRSRHCDRGRDSNRREYTLEHGIPLDFGPFLAERIARLYRIRGAARAAGKAKSTKCRTDLFLRK
jgi:hypothetical protein